MKTPEPNITRSILLLGLVALAPATAQSIDGEVVRNPDETVTYDFRLDGPPNTLATILVSPFSLAAPLPTPFGPLFLDPLLILPVTSVPLNQTGHASVQLTFPAALSLNTPFYFQAFVATPFGGQLTQNVLTTVQGGDPLGNDGPGRGFGIAHSGTTASAQVFGQPGLQYEIIIRDPRGNVVGGALLTIGQNGRSRFVRFNCPQIRQGFTYQVWQVLDGGQRTLAWDGRFN